MRQPSYALHAAACTNLELLASRAAPTLKRCSPHAQAVENEAVDEKLKATGQVPVLPPLVPAPPRGRPIGTAGSSASQVGVLSAAALLQSA